MAIFHSYFDITRGYMSSEFSCRSWRPQGTHSRHRPPQSTADFASRFRFRLPAETPDCRLRNCRSLGNIWNIWKDIAGDFFHIWETSGKLFADLFLGTIRNKTIRCEVESIRDDAGSSRRGGRTPCGIMPSSLSRAVRSSNNGVRDDLIDRYWYEMNL